MVRAAHAPDAYRQLSNLLEIPKYFCLSRAAVRREPVGAGLILRRCPVSRPGNKFWSGSDAFSAHTLLQAGFGFLSPDPQPSEMAILAGQIFATGALPRIPVIMRSIGTTATSRKQVN